MDTRDYIRLITDPAYTPEDTQPLSFGGAWHPGSRAAGEGGTPLTRTLGETAARLDAVGHTVCDLTRDDLHSLLVLVRLDRARLLSERRAYVKARGADHTRFTELLRSLTAQIDALNKLADKLAKLHVVGHDARRGVTP